MACCTPWAAPSHASAAMAAAPAVHRVIDLMPETAVFSPGSAEATPARSGVLALMTEPAACAAVSPLPRATTCPRSSITTARAGRSDRSRPRLSIDVPLHLAPLERQRTRVGGPEKLAVHPRQQAPQPPFVRRAEHDHAGPFVGRKLPVVEIIAVQGHERAPKLPRQAEMFDIARAAEIVMLEHEQHIPS